jgi:hypothetical protein
VRSLTDLLATPEGRDFLAEHHMHSDTDEFANRLEPPQCEDLVQFLDLASGTRLVHIGQQVCTDYEPATLTKFEAATELNDRPGIVPAILWHDTDRADSERFGMRIVLPAGSKVVGVPLAPRSAGSCEPRFIRVPPEAVEEALDHLDRWASGRTKDKPKPERLATKARLAQLSEAVRAGTSRTLGEFNAAMAGFLLHEGLGLAIRSTFLSTMLDRGMLTQSVNRYLDCIDDVIAVFNEAVSDLVTRDIDPQVKPLSANYLPLHYSCPTTGRRLRLSHVRQGSEHVATGECPCGTAHSFPLGSSHLTIDELEATGRWSPDISLPIHHIQIASGWIVGRSTALYGIVLNTVARQVLGYRLIPGLIPPSLTSSATPLGTDSLLVAFLGG